MGHEEKSIIQKCKIIHKILRPLPEYDHRTPNSELPENGVYFFYEDNEFYEHDNKRQKRIVRVGTHRVDGRFRSRINNHYSGDKNSSVFRKHIGGALMRKRKPTDSRIKQWLEQDTPTFKEIEIEVSRVLKNNFSFKCVPVKDREERLELEEQLIATLSKCPICTPSKNWLGRYAQSDLIRKSGLWNTQYVFSNSIITDNAIKRLKELVNESNNKKKRALFFIPCCSEKRPNGDGPPWKKIRSKQNLNKFQFLDDYRLQLINFYSSLSKKDAPNYYKNRGSGATRDRKVEKAWKRNLELFKSNTMKAIDRYNGKLYRALDDNIRDALRNGNIDNVIIVSALMGIIAPTDLISDYELMMGDKSPTTMTISDYWSTTFENEVINTYIRELLSKYDYIYCLMSDTTGYVSPLQKILSESEAYHIYCPDAGQNSPRIWGAILNDCLREKYVYPEEVEQIIPIYDCEMRKLYEIKRGSIPRQKTIVYKGGIGLGLTDKIRKFVCENFIEPARKRGEKEITIRAGDVHSRMRLSSRMPAVCSALKSKIDRLCNVEILDIKAPPSGQGANFYVTYKILGTSNELVSSELKEVEKKEVIGDRRGIPELLRELAKLRNEGIITNQEFEKKKKELLDRL